MAHLAQSLPGYYFLKRVQGLSRVGNGGRGSRIPSSKGSSRRGRERETVGTSGAGPRLFVCDHDGRPPRRGVGGNVSLKGTGSDTGLVADRHSRRSDR